MNRPTFVDKDRLAAFVDGELSPEEAAAMVMHLADHPTDQAYVDDLVSANEALAQAFAEPLHEPVPNALRDLILGTTLETSVVQFQRKSAFRPAMSLWTGMAGGAALAAGLAVLVFLPQVHSHDLVPGKLPVGGELHQALVSLPAGMPLALADGGEALILSSVPTPNGYCREIEVTHGEGSNLQAALVCTEGEGWTVEVVISENLADASEADGFGTASGDEAQGFSPFLDRIGAGIFLEPDAEAAAMARGWTK